MRFFNTELKNEALDLIKDVVIIGLIVFVIRTFFVLPFQINGQSMYQSYYDGEFIIVDRYTYRFSRSPDRGDVIVFKPHVSKEKEYFLKRIIGVPGDRLKIENGKVYLFSKQTNAFEEMLEPYLSEENKNATFVNGDKNSYTYDVPAGEYFVVGDNRNHSTDSRACFSSCYIPGTTNFIRESDITGKILLDLGYFRLTKLDFVHPELGIDTHPRWLSSASTHTYTFVK